MNKHLGVIIQSIVADTRYMKQADKPLDALYHTLFSMDDGCECIYCNDCMLGYKDNQYYTTQIIKTWRQL